MSCDKLIMFTYQGFKILDYPIFPDLRFGVGLKRVTVSKEKCHWSLGVNISLGWVLSSSAGPISQVSKLFSRNLREGEGGRGKFQDL